MKAILNLRRKIAAILNDPIRRASRNLTACCADLTDAGCHVIYARVKPNILIQIEPPPEHLIDTWGNVSMMSSSKRGEVIYNAMRGNIHIQWIKTDPAIKEDRPRPRQGAKRLMYARV